MNEIRAFYTDEYVRVYQAYNHTIGDQAVREKCFNPPFKTSRMTWIKPSFCWMAYRSGYSFKDVNQECILAIDIKRKAFDVILQQAVSAKDSKGLANVILQWDPERNVSLEPLSYRSIQIGIRGSVLEMYAKGDIIVNITNVTPLFQQVHVLVQSGSVLEAVELLPQERVYPF
ncbi:hypothetical protein HDV02_003762 [Globomyces sp. JEL0801]|nr:hypothetical protein HDV02_003762 [Globomyces sp. JEL0801]